MEPDIKRIKIGIETKEGEKQEKAKHVESLPSSKSLEDVEGDNQEHCLSSSMPTDDLCNEKDQISNDDEKEELLVNRTSLGATQSSDQDTHVQVLSLAASFQNPCTSENAHKMDPLVNRISNLSKADQRTSVPNGSGQKLESIIGRLSSDRIVAALTRDDEDALICKADASTQTSPDFVKIVKCLVFRRMKQLEQSLIRDAVTDSVLDGKLVDLEKENRDLRKSVKKLQDKLELIIQSFKSDESIAVSRVKEVLENAQSQNLNDLTSDNSSSIRKQSAVVSPYHVQCAPSESHTQGNKLREITERPHTELIEVSRAYGKGAPSSNSIVPEEIHGLVSMGINYNPVTRHGPQVKYVPQRLHTGPHHGGTPKSQFINLAQSGVVMHRLPVQRAGGFEYASRPQTGPVIYTTQSVQVTGPRMSTIPPQPQQASQHGNQRPIVSPSGIGTRLHQSGQAPRLGGNLLHLQGSSQQTVHYIPQNVMHYMTPVKQTLPFNSHKMATQASSSEIGEHQALPQPIALNAEHQKKRPTIPTAPPPYQLPRAQNEQPPIPQKVHANQLNISQVSRVQNDQLLPPRLQVNITVSGNGIVLSWDFESEPLVKVPVIECYHLFASQDSPTPPVLSSEWKKIGVVKALPLPMACTLTQFVSGNSYHFAVLAVDVNGREGPLSNSCTVRLNN